jgi:hypothetical protein
LSRGKSRPSYPNDMGIQISNLLWQQNASPSYHAGFPRTSIHDVEQTQAFGTLWRGSHPFLISLLHIERRMFSHEELFPIRYA